MPEDVFELFEEYVTAYACGERPVATEYLERAAPEDDRLASLLDEFLSRAPVRDPDPEDVEFVRRLLASAPPAADTLAPSAGMDVSQPTPAAATSRRISVLVAQADDVDSEAIESTLTAGTELDVVGFRQGLGDLRWLDFLHQPSDVVVVGCEEFSHAAAHIVDRAVKQRPDRPVVVLAQRSPDGSLRSAFESGADDVITLPQTPQDVQFAFEKVIARSRAVIAVPALPVAPLICVLGPKGGSGKTLVATNLAVALARRDRRVVLVDLDLQFGDVGLALGISPQQTIHHLVRERLPFDHDKLDRHLMAHSSGVRVLVGPTRPEQGGAVTVEYLRDIYASLRTMCDVVIVDTPPAFTPEVAATIDVSTTVCMVGMLDRLSLKNTGFGLEALDLMGYASENISFVLNRADSQVGLTLDDVSTTVGRQPDVQIPSDREIARSINEGRPIVVSRGRSGAARAFERLADRYSKPAVTTGPRELRGRDSNPNFLIQSQASYR